ncbi:tryptophan--tRNA ligase [Phenylobacterium sp.]|uniref:tryptophan--tRNA ligase n=1 Tax=Phenylobacterium sp. TaxID=1871053 RepID=UPI002DEA8823|nr:tryptophan--tRNA ligase [Phenylobacterium sp.]
MTDQAPAPYQGPQRVLSGVQPTGDLHLGNYLGALVKFARLQHEIPTFIFVADQHAITEWQDPARLKDQVREITAAYLATGLDPKVATIFAQSAVPEHTELAWVFDCVARVGWLDRMTQFKDKAGKHKERASVGLYAYPVLQAADILLYKATAVPVGEDQRQHLELTRDIAAKFNHDFEVPGFFPLPDALTQGPGARVMSLRDGQAKMSKSDPSDYSRINLADDADAIAQKVRKARTDAEPLPEKLDDLAARPEALNLVSIYAALAGRTAQEVLSEFAGQGFGAFKPKLADLAVSVMGPIGGEMRRLLADPAEIDRILGDGAARARALAAPTMAEVRKIVGFWNS